MQGKPKLLNTTERINSGLELVTEKYHNWKQILSGALNDKQLVSGLVVIFWFYVFYSVFNTVIGNDQDEDNLTCQCPLSHRRFYQTIVITSGFCWILCFVGITIYDSYVFIKYRRSMSLAVAPTSIKRCNRDCNVPAMNDVDSTDDDLDTTSLLNTPQETLDDKYLSQLDDTLKLCENHLWLEFYKAYSVGASAYESEKHPDIKDIVNKFTKDNTNGTREKSEAMARLPLAPMDDNDHQQEEDDVDSGEKEAQDEVDYGINDVETIAKKTFFFFYPFLVIVRLFAQVFAVPMLILQMLNTYSWICITGDYYCQNTKTHYQMGLYQAYVTFAFYIALLIAILATTMLRWFPYSKDARNIGAASCV